MNMRTRVIFMYSELELYSQFAVLLSIIIYINKRLLFGRLRETKPSLEMTWTTLNRSTISSTKNYTRTRWHVPSDFPMHLILFYGTKPPLTKTIVANLTYAAKKFLLTTLHKSCLEFITPFTSQRFLWLPPSPIRTSYLSPTVKDDCRELELPRIIS